MNSMQDVPSTECGKMEWITVTLNGQPFQLPADCSVKRMLELTEMRDQLVAVEVNLDVVPKAQHSAHQLMQDDRVEVVSLVGGG